MDLSSAAIADVLARIGAGVLALDKSMSVVWLNRSVFDRVGGLATTGQPVEQLFEQGEVLADRLRALTRAANGRALIPACRLRRSHGAAATVDVVADASGADAGTAVVLTLLDADERAALQAELARVQAALAASERARDKMDALSRELSAPGGGAGAPGAVRIIGASAPMLAMLDQIERVARSDATVLIHGESGSGKELVARSLHQQSARAARAMVAVNCAAIPETLLESELFGHERGAFTGADRQRLGKFELADTGSLFLDEIGELSLAAQAKLLRVLQEGTLERVGGTQTIQVDVRLICATHRDLAQQVERGRFREDLYYRLNVFRIEVPSLRDRREDVRPLAEFFHDLHARRLGRPVLPISERSLRRLMTYDWPGNVRELENTVERATVLSDEGDPELEVQLPEGGPSRRRSRDDDAPGEGATRATSELPRDVLLDLTIDQLQRLQIMHALETRRYRVFGEGGAAEKLGLNPQTLLSRMDKLGIPRPRVMRKSLKA
ncbi:MAG: sigma 54-interacting transcriptional regulator [Planctomycetes bacterium]|nr:sigma 54-interacting transcriptional regulator [Planctomycetota bacterium]